MIINLKSFVLQVIPENQTLSVCVAKINHHENDFKNAGYRNLENRIPANKETVFANGSASKGFCSTALCLFVNDEKLKVDEKRKNCFPELQLFDEPATHTNSVRHLLCHRLGISFYNFVLHLSGWGTKLGEIVNRWISRNATT